jgi:hypothetical protein
MIIKSTECKLDIIGPAFLDYETKIYSTYHTKCTKFSLCQIFLFLAADPIKI